jgi:hypothetical protein
MGANEFTFAFIRVNSRVVSLFFQAKRRRRLRRRFLPFVVQAFSLRRQPERLHHNDVI